MFQVATAGQDEGAARQNEPPHDQSQQPLSDTKYFTTPVANMAATAIQTGMFSNMDDFHQAYYRQKEARMEPGKLFTLPPQIPKTCAVCQRPATCICPLCFEALYCGRDCQLDAWRSHEADCHYYRSNAFVCRVAQAEAAYTGANSRVAAGGGPADELDDEDEEDDVEDDERGAGLLNKLAQASVEMARANVPHNGMGMTAAGRPARESAPARGRWSEEDPMAARHTARSLAGLVAAAAQGPSSDGDFRCTVPFCGKVFKQSSSLKSHVRSHTGEKPFVCPFEGCSKGFSASFALRRHERIHTGEKSFKCDTCTKMFSRKDALKQHARVHQRGKDYQSDE